MSDAVLFCNEGGQHVKRASSRVSQPPGGKTSFNIFGGDEAPPAQPARGRGAQQQQQQQDMFGQAPPQQPQHQQQQYQQQQAPFAGQPQAQMGGRKVQKEVSGKVGEFQQQQNQPVGGNQAGQAQGQDGAGYNALFCNEGAQVRTRPARKIVQPPGGASSIFG